MPKAIQASQAKVLTDIPNIGVSIAKDLRGVGITTPAAVSAMDPLAVYESLRGPMGPRHDPCVLDTFISAVRFMEGAPPHPWWHYTRERKARYPGV